MAISFTGSLSLAISALLDNDSDLSSAKDALKQTFGASFTNGTGLNQANNAFGDRRTLGAGANEDLDLAGGTLGNIFGALTFTKLKAIIIHLPVTKADGTAQVGPLTVSRPAANGVPFLAAASDALPPLTPGGFFCLSIPSANGITVTTSTGDLINVANGAGVAQEYNVILFGVV